MFQFRHHAVSLIFMVMLVTMVLLMSIGDGGMAAVVVVVALTPRMQLHRDNRHYYYSSVRRRDDARPHYGIGPAAAVQPSCILVSASSSTTTTTRLAAGSIKDSQSPAAAEDKKEDAILQPADHYSSPTVHRSTAASSSLLEPVVRLLLATAGGALATMALLLVAAMTVVAPDEALAAVTDTSSSSNVVATAAAAIVNTNVVLQNAIVAYGHYLGLLLVTALLTYERVTVAADMTAESEKSLVIADALYGLTALFLFGTGYLRATEFGKGWDFYAHEPFFWLKLASGGILAGLSLFPTITYIRRGRVLFTDDTAPTDWQPMSDALVTRLHKVINAELTAIATIPLFATLMARGVGYSNTDGSFFWPAGAALTAVTLVGSSVLYARQALSWVEPPPPPTDETEMTK
jgi:putative membrane protein